MDRSRIRKAGMLLSKAESTDSDAEAQGLVLHAYRLLAAQLNQWESVTDPAGGPRRRERRFLRDRRRGSTDPSPEVPASSSAESEPGRDVNRAYRRFDGTEDKSGHVDLSL